MIYNTEMLIFSEMSPSLLLHGVYKKSDLLFQANQRVDLSSEDQTLQISALNILKPKVFQAHYHLEKKLGDFISKAQECWVVIAGKVEVSYFDLDNTLIRKTILDPGDISYTFHGGHGYEVLDSNSLIYEFKSGPYLGVEKDKKLIL
jgi:hypothetical protein